MSTTIKTDHLRVTSIPFSTGDFVIFSGVPIKRDSYKVNNGKYYITIKSRVAELPIMPAIGQHWSIKGLRTVEDTFIDDYVLQQHTYDSPDEARCTLPEDGEQLIRFIAKEKDFTGIGESKARALWEALGENLHSVLAVDIPESRSCLKGLLSSASIDAIFRGYAKYKNLSACNWMSTHNIPASIQQRLIKHHDAKSIDSIKQNPYILLGFGMDFKDIDSIAQSKLKIADDDNNRLSAAVEMAIRHEINKGHTYTTQSDIRPMVKRLLGSSTLATQAFMVSHQKAQFILNNETFAYHPTAQLLMESVVAKRLRTLAGQKNLFINRSKDAFLSAINELPYSLTDKQREAVLATLDNAASCITGGAGTGKTTVLRTALRAYKQMGYTIHAVALSGRAAMRLHESIGFTTMTIAALLRQEPVEPDLAEPDHLLVIDEASMIDLPTMYRLVTHIHPSVRIVFTGDPNQLPPIGCGKVLSDIVEAKTIANTKLDIVKRQEGFSGIPEYSKLVNAGILPGNLTTGAITFHETAKEHIAQRCTELFLTSPSNSRIMGATKNMVADINKLTQNSVNPDGQRLEFTMNGEQFFIDFRLGDVILFTQNNYDKGIQNGSLGKLASVEAEGESYGSVELDTGEEVEVIQPILDSMQLGYCITLHKAQGSQFPRVIIALQKGRIVDRAWIYTAITRAEAEVHIVGSAEDFKAITQSPSHTHRRNSYLRDLLAED